MPVHTFSTRTKRPIDTEVVTYLKDHCDRNGLNFSALVIKLLKEHADELKARSN